MGIVVIGLAGLTLIAVALRDARDGIIPDQLNIALAILGFVFHLTEGVSAAALADMIAGSLCLAGTMAALRLAFFRLRGVEALGLGDVKFGGAAGIWVGLGGVPPLLLVASASTLVWTLSVALIRRQSLDDLRATEIPFGPGLCFGLATTVAIQLVL